MDNLYLTFFLLFFTFSTFETKRNYDEKKPCDDPHGVCFPGNLNDFHSNSHEIIEKYYNQKANQYYGLIDSFRHYGLYNDQNDDYAVLINDTYIVSCYAFHIDMEICKDPKMRKDWTCEAGVC